jgi:copper chaperone
MVREEITIEGMSCEHCKMTVEKAVSSVEGVSSVSVDLKSGKADVTYDASKASLEDIKRAIEAAGYTPK